MDSLAQAMMYRGWIFQIEAEGRNYCLRLWKPNGDKFCLTRTFPDPGSAICYCKAIIYMHGVSTRLMPCLWWGVIICYVICLTYFLISDTKHGLENLLLIGALTMNGLTAGLHVSALINDKRNFWGGAGAVSWIAIPALLGAYLHLNPTVALIVDIFSKFGILLLLGNFLIWFQVKDL